MLTRRAQGGVRLLLLLLDGDEDPLVLGARALVLGRFRGPCVGRRDSPARRRQKDGAGSFLAKCCSKSGFVAIDVYFHCKEPTHSDTLWAIGPPPRAGQPPACLYPSTFPIR